MKKKKILSLILAIALVFTLGVPVFGAAAATKAPVEIVVEGVKVSASVDKLNGNQNKLWITVKDVGGTTTKDFMINNNAEGSYSIRTGAGLYTIYVDTKGNTQIRACYIVSFFETCDTVIKNGDVRTMDGGKTAEAVGIKDGKVLFIGSNKKAEDYIGANTVVIDAAGNVVSPGFIDLHTHSDSMANNTNRLAENYLRQGVTTFLGGNCGYSGAGGNLRQYLDRVIAAGPAINYGTLVGHRDLRDAAGTPRDVASNALQIATMRGYMDQAMKDGAFGLSTGIEYVLATSTEEIIGVAEIAGLYGGFYSTHMRDERDYLEEAIEESILIGKEANIAVQISHIKADGIKNWIKTEPVIELIKAARASGQDVSMDVYPYEAWSSGISLFLTGGGYTTAGLRAAINAGNTELVGEMTAHVAWEMDEFYESDGDLIRLVSYTDRGGVNYDAKSLSDVLRNRGQALTNANLADLIIDILAHASPSIIAFGMTEENVIKNMKQEFTSIGSDGSVRAYSVGPHPRNYGTFPRVLGHFVRDIGAISLDDALYRMTVNPAKRFGFTDRGMIKEGYWADITIFNPDTVADNATFEGGGAPPSGIHYVLVNGVVVIDDTNFIAGQLANRPGHVLFGPGREN